MADSSPDLYKEYFRILFEMQKYFKSLIARKGLVAYRKKRDITETGVLL